MLKNTTICYEDHDLTTISERSTRIHDSKNEKQWCPLKHLSWKTNLLTFAIGAFWIILSVSTLVEFVEFLKKSTVKTGLNIYSYFPA